MTDWNNVAKRVSDVLGGFMTVEVAFGGVAPVGVRPTIASKAWNSYKAARTKLTDEDLARGLSPRTMRAYLVEAPAGVSFEDAEWLRENAQEQLKIHMVSSIGPSGVNVLHKIYAKVP